MRLTFGDHPVPGFAAAYAEQLRRFPGGPAAWQPVHTVYVPADRFDRGTVRSYGDAALELLDTHLPAGADPAPVFGPLPAGVRERVARKLAAEPVEDLRIDFEDGYGARPAAEEDRHAVAAAREVAAMHAAGGLPRRWGLRVRSFADGDPERSLRTLDGFLTEVTGRAGTLPAGLRITFPKVLMEDYLRQFAGWLARLEEGLRLPAGTLRFEMQVEAPQTVMMLLRSPDLAAGLDGRLAAAHFGVFDHTAACGLPPAEQRLDHPACDHAREVTRLALAGTAVELSDGSLAAAPASTSTADVHALWRAHAALVRHSLANGFYQGWDMHPAHLVSRYATVYAFHLSARDAYAERVRAFRERREVDGVLDEPATVAALAAALRRAGHALGEP
ncbi:aldolase [Sphaerisporangium rufum]|uniref:Aldolase n=1 Tax=Sphaerisporangium rufum TaxID=1381558 RepID=A0A919V5E3_9ACTN|nr:aldolase [Sphaerisporangium rufum]GII78225.1 aldolase [Sphaerisporangium rufum]